MTAPSNNEFRIAGALGLETDPTPQNAEVLLQGLGFPLRPISAVPTTDSPDISAIVAKGLTMQWMANWQEGLFYPQGSFVRDGAYTLVANKLTLDKAAPIPDPADPATLGLPDPWVGATTEVNTSVVACGQTYTFSQNGWIKELKVFVTELTVNTNYRIFIVDITNPEAPITTVINDPLLVVDEWKIIALLDQGVQVGTILTIGIDALNTGADTNISGGWIYSGPTQPPAAPVPEAWTQDNQRTSFRISKIDLDSVDRSTELEGVIPDSLITAVQTDDVGRAIAYRVDTVTDSGTFMTYGVVLQSETGGGPAPLAVCTLDIDVPIPLPTEYAEELAVWGTLPSWASSVEGFLEFDGVDQGVDPDTAYGVDILFEPAEVSPDWDIVSFTG